MTEGRWQDRYKKFVMDAGGKAYDPDEELEVMEKLIYDTRKVGDAAVACLERMTSEDMFSQTVGMVLLLTEFRSMLRNE